MSFFDLLDSNIKGLFSQAIFEAIQFDMREDRTRKDFSVYPMPWARMWGHIATNIEALTKGTNLVVVRVQRQNWPFILVFDRENKVLFSLMSKNRFVEIQKMGLTKTHHYLDYLVCGFNSELSPTQLALDLPDEYCEKYSQEELEVQLTKLIPEFKDDVTRHILVCFDRKDEFVYSIYAYILSAGFQISDEENWTKYAEKSYRPITHIIDNQKITASGLSDELTVSLKADKLKINTNE